MTIVYSDIKNGINNYINDNLGVYISLKILNYSSSSFQNIPINILNNLYKIIINPEYPDSLSFLIPITEVPERSITGDIMLLRELNCDLILNDL